ncbi:SAM-dependent methyltransferase [Roseicyclus sp. F158]|uniref:SAM-dependent methyltransferase n=1 Tax=Tropicimonas omnivorans TaxID=3075590 RepID=A0ABU3DDG0_9RHOB|nr:SAM-dependent methyltransferase [Roseicyclus sp. F158]MDT0681758.1 SAM-dependent methyltransferase [Roseicyclus sp. F158]
MTDLARLLEERIRAAGPLTLADYMAECLLHPEHGYYTGGRVFGASGDFITAPEVSQMFGELVGLALAQGWMDRGQPERFVLAELGPGRGTLMADALRAAERVPGFVAAAEVVLVEASPRLREVQAETLADRSPRWLDSVEQLPEAPLFLIANEFFDALPIRQFQRDGETWRERVIGLGPEGGLAMGLADAAPPGAAPRASEGGDVVEICPSLPTVAGTIAARIKDHGGLALMIDYGAEGGRGDTFQAVQNHAYADPLAAPGQADLTAHVDFAALARAGEWAGLRASGPLKQGLWLGALGIVPRAQALARAVSDRPGGIDEVRSALERLTDPSQMGSLFKVLAFDRPDAPLPAGFAP